MLGGGDQRRMSIDGEAANSPVSMNKALVLSDPLAQIGAHSQPVESIINHSKKLQDDLQVLGQKIKHHEDNVKYLNALTNKLEDSILGLQVALGKYHTSYSMRENGDSAQGKSEEEIMECIMKHEGTAAALFCRLKNHPEVQIPDNSLIKDVLGVVATLGQIDDYSLNRMLSEYLGLDTMLAVICKTYEGVEALEAYREDGLINGNLGLHALASAGKPLAGRFQVFCLEDISPYDGALIPEDPQRRLDLIKPRLHSGTTPPGFLGFAVNMITIDPTHLYCGVPKTGHSLRETLFFHLFGSLQVYNSRKDMLKARHSIPSGAISLDGGIIRSSGLFSLGHNQDDVDVKFPVGSIALNFPESYFDTENQMKETKWKKDRAKEDLQREQEQLNRAKVNFETKKQEFLKYLSQSSFYVSQVGRAPTPR